MLCRDSVNVDESEQAGSLLMLGDVAERIELLGDLLLLLL
jgi:hypothetical protein